MPNLTTREWLFMAGVYLMGSAAMALIMGFIRGWRGPSNHDLQRAVVTMTKWMQKTNTKMEKENRGRIVHITVADTGAMSSVLAPPEKPHAR